MTRTPAALAVAAATVAASAAQACEVPLPLRPELAVITPVIARGEVVAVEPDGRGGAVLTLAVTETLKGTEAETWAVAWDAWSVVPPPETVEAFVARFGTDVVLGLTPAVPGIAVDDAPARIEAGEGALAQENCTLPFLDSYAALVPMLAERGLTD